MRVLLAVLLFAACLNAFSSPTGDHCADSAPAVPICRIVENAAKYDGKKIAIAGLYRAVLHGSILTDSACPDVYVNVRRTADWKASRKAVAVIRSLTKKNKFESVDVISRGIFRVAREGQCFGQNCLQYEFEESQLLCATAPKVKSSPSSAGLHPKSEQ